MDQERRSPGVESGPAPLLPESDEELRIRFQKPLPVSWIAIKLMQTFSEDYDSVRVDEVVRLIRSDESLTSGVLRQANSAAYGPRVEVTELDRAAAFIGLKGLRQFALTTAFRSILDGSGRSLYVRRCWRHNLACAFLSEEIAHAFSMHPDTAYVGGLLHDIGRLVLLREFPNEYAILLANADAADPGFLIGEQSVFRTDHCEVGALVGKEWRLPDHLAQVAAEHHQAPGSRTFELPGLVHFACRLADSIGFAVSEDSQPQPPAEIVESLPESGRSLVAQTLDELVESVTEKISEQE